MRKPGSQRDFGLWDGSQVLDHSPYLPTHIPYSKRHYNALLRDTASKIRLTGFNPLGSLISCVTLNTYLNLFLNFLIL